MNCPKCGTTFEGSFCPDCGTAADAPSDRYARAGELTDLRSVPVAAPKSRGVALLLCFFLGWMGAHRFYLGCIGSGIVYLLTVGVCGVGWLVDLLQLLAGNISWFGAVKKQQADDLMRQNDFHATSELRVGSSVITIDQNSKRWILRNPSTTRLYAFRDIVDVEIQEDNQTTVKASTSSMLGRGVVGGVLFGGVGAVIGGVTGKKNVSHKRTKLGVRVILSDLQNPVAYIDCMYSQSDIDKVYGTFVAMMGIAQSPANAAQ